MSLRPLLFALLLSSATGCMTVHAVNPRPNVVIPASSPKYSVDVSHVPDKFELDRITIDEFKKTMNRGFKNAVGSRLGKVEDHDSVVLVFDNVEAELNNLGSIGKFITLRFRGRWLTPDHELIAEFAGVAEPRNPTETGERHLEDVVEVLYEKAVNGLDEATRERQPRRGEPVMNSTRL